MNEYLNAYFPTIVRYLGLGLLVFLIVDIVLMDKVDHPGLIVAATGMIGYKEVVKSRNGKKQNDTENP